MAHPASPRSQSLISQRLSYIRQAKDGKKAKRGAGLSKPEKV